MEKNFVRSSKVVLNLVKASFALGREGEAAESVRVALTEASRFGARQVLKSEGLL